MGVDFIKKCAKGFRKSWGRGKNALASQNLFSKTPDLGGRTYCADLVPGAKADPNRQLLVRADGNRLRILDGDSEIGALRDCPQALLDTIARDGCGVAFARIERLHELSGTMDVSVA